MNSSLPLLASILALGLSASTLLAQQDRPQGAPPEGRPDRGPGARAFANPVMAALDADQDGELSSEEVNNAVVALKKLDKNNDGKLDRDELRPPARPGAGAGPAGGAGNFSQRIMAMDADKDGKVTAAELPERMQRLLERADTNQDGAIDKAEAEAMNDAFGGGRGRPQGAPPRGQPQN